MSDPHARWLELTPKQLECLRASASAPINPFDYGSTSIASLKRLGYIKGAKVLGVTRYSITETGACALAKDGKL